MALHQTNTLHQYEPVDGQRPWTPGLVSRMPWLGMGAIVGALASLAASAAILICSDGKPISTWSFQPSTYIAITSTLANLCLLYALKEGANIAWWRRAMQKDTTLGDLHRYWSFGSSFQEALLSGRRINILAVACVSATIAQVNGPLLQRASKVVIETVNTTATVNLRLTSELPTGYTGAISGRARDVALFMPDYAKVVQIYNVNGPIAIGGTGCTGICSAYVAGVGLSLNCSAYEVPFNINEAASPDPQFYVAINGTDVFETEFVWNGGSASNISLGVLYKETSDCSGVLQVKNCTIHAASVRYPVVIDSNKSTIALDPSTTVFDDLVSGLVPTESVDWYEGNSTLGGYWLALKNRFQSTAHLRWVGAAGYELVTTGNTATQYAVLSEDTDPALQASSCGITFANPLDDLLASARDLMFRTSIAATNSSTPVQSLPANEQQQRAVFRSSYPYLAGALGVTVVAIALVLCIFSGYRQLGRKVTMSPLELAKAFNAPTLLGHDSNATVSELLQELGHRGIRYGAVAVDERTEADAAPSPFVGSKYASFAIGDYVPDSRMRLELASTQQHVYEPRKGWTFVG
ncbi:hypothetical protein H2200_002226 [Cladophialophora chaetospira]|uniref:Uncharacterized protein n=1 Tax=Cladophialophora chaetospira TaxID=386627 RepID=A0AA39CNB8_9EURO|nr:hypothetical protein H2200_002226 [Cladophialophora chaetospira]